VQSGLINHIKQEIHMTNIANISGKWYVVRQEVNSLGISAWVKISQSFDTSYEARAYQLEVVMGRVS
jgi:hypothetical protein